MQTHQLKNFSKEKTIHFVGILLSQGYKVSGSDSKESGNTIKIKDQGANVFIDHQASNVREAHWVVVSSAIASDNPELVYARENNIPILKRAEMLSLLMDRGQYRIAVAGTHGKTTTSSMLAYLLQQAGRNPTYVIGGVLQNTGSNAGLGGDEYFVVEADESDSSLLLMNPNVLIITNVEADHMDHFENYEQIQNLFEQCIAKLPKDGLLIVCADDPGIRLLLKSAQEKNILPSNVISYGFEEGLTYRAENIRYEKNHIRFSMIRPAQKTMVEMELSIPGKHNVLNSLAVAVLAQYFRIPQSVLKTALRDFRGARRRFMQLGERHDILVIDDYAHHPTEIQSVLEATRSGWPDRKLVAVFQPHRFTRTHYFQKEFAQALALADEVVLTDVYAASEKPMEGISGQTILKWLGDVPHQYFKRKEEVSLYLAETVAPRSVVVVMGAGDINHVAKDYWNRLQQKEFHGQNHSEKVKVA